MKAAKRPRPSKIAALNFRVYRIPKLLKESVGAARTAKGQTVEAFVNGAVDEHLEALVKVLLQSLGEKSSAGTVPARLPMHDETTKALSAASAKIGVPASHLFLACLNRASAIAPTRRRRGK